VLLCVGALWRRMRRRRGGGGEEESTVNLVYLYPVIL